MMNITMLSARLMLPRLRMSVVSSLFQFEMIENACAAITPGVMSDSTAEEVLGRKMAVHSLEKPVSATSAMCSLLVSLMSVTISAARLAPNRMKMAMAAQGRPRFVSSMSSISAGSSMNGYVQAGRHRDCFAIFDFHQNYSQIKPSCSCLVIYFGTN